MALKVRLEAPSGAMHSDDDEAHALQPRGWFGAQGCSSDALASTKTAYDNFLADAQRLAAVRAAAAKPGVTPEQAKVLAIMEKTFT